jgi:hypothetical protein
MVTVTDVGTQQRSNAMQQPENPNPANPVPNLSALTLLEPELQSAIDVYVQMVKGASKITPVDSQRVLARRVCKMAQVLSAVSKSAIPPDFYRVYAINMEIPGANRWPDVTEANRNEIRKRLTSWCQKLDTRESATAAATRQGVPIEEVLWLAKRGALPLPVIHAFVKRPDRVAAEHWDALIDALGGEAALKHDVLVPSTAGLTEEEYDDWLIRIFIAVLVYREAEEDADPLDLSRRFEAAFKGSLTDDHYEAIAASLVRGQWTQAQHLIDTEIADAHSSGYDTTDHTRQMVLNATRALVHYDEPAPLIRHGLEELIGGHPQYVGSVLFGALLGFRNDEHIAWLVERHFRYPESTGHNMSWATLCALLLDLSGNRVGWPSGLLVSSDLPTTKQHAKFVSLVVAIEKLPQPTPSHYIDQHIASVLLGNACGTRAPSGLWLEQHWDLPTARMLLVGPGNLRGRFTPQALREAVRSVWGGVFAEGIASDVSGRLEVLQALVADYPRDLLSSPAFVGIACRVIKDVFTKGTQPNILRSDLDVDNGYISTQQFLQVLNVFVDAGMVFTMPNAGDLSWIKHDLVLVRANLNSELATEQTRPDFVRRAQWIPYRLQYIDAILPALSMID